MLTRPTGCHASRRAVSERYTSAACLAGFPRVSTWWRRLGTGLTMSTATVAMSEFEGGASSDASAPRLVQNQQTSTPTPYSWPQGMAGSVMEA